MASQAYCSVLPVAYGHGSPASWGPSARLVLEASLDLASD